MKNFKIGFFGDGVQLELLERVVAGPGSVLQNFSSSRLERSQNKLECSSQATFFSGLSNICEKG
jgi:hypothetical protein